VKVPPGCGPEVGFKTDRGGGGDNGKIGLKVDQ
jgi:hypothetical protein